MIYGITMVTINLTLNNFRTNAVADSAHCVFPTL